MKKRYNSDFLFLVSKHFGSRCSYMEHNEFYFLRVGIDLVPLFPVKGLNFSQDDFIADIFGEYFSLLCFK